MQEPLVSVVLPIYKVEKYLNRCIESVVCQTYKNLEIILVDDGSPDLCPQMCDEWAQKDNRIKVIHKPNGGLGKARNTGIENANGEYIFFFDSDDYVDKTIVEKCVASTYPEQTDVVLFGRYNRFEDGTLSEMKVTADKLVFDCDTVRSELLSGLFTYDMGMGVSAWGKMYRLSTINNNGLRFKSEKEIISEDSYFMLEFFSCVTRAVIVPECLYYYCERGDSLSHKYNSERYEKNNDFLVKSLDLIKKNGLPDKVAVHLKARYHAFMISALKQIYLSDLTSEERKKEIKRVYHDPVLRSTLEYGVLRTEKIFTRVFFCLLKFRLCFLCNALLRLRVSNPK